MKNFELESKVMIKMAKLNMLLNNYDSTITLM